MHCMNLYVYQPLISTGFALCDAAWCPWNTTYILYQNNHDGSKPVSNTCVPCTSTMLYTASTSGLAQVLYLKGISCGNNFPALSYHHDKNVLQLSPTEPPPFLNLYHRFCFLRTMRKVCSVNSSYISVSRVSVYDLPPVTIKWPFFNVSLLYKIAFKMSTLFFDNL